MARLPAIALSILSLAASAFAPVPVAQAADWVQGYKDNGSLCSAPGLLGRVEEKFRYQVHNVPHLPDVAIVDFHNIHVTRYQAATDNSPIERLYCGATVSLSDGSRRAAWYLVEYGMGFASIGDNVEFCVAGFDRWMVYNGGCRILR
jgi:hypothetical protein